MRVYGVEIGGTAAELAQEWRDAGATGTTFRTEDVGEWVYRRHGWRVEGVAWHAAYTITQKGKKLGLWKRTEESRRRKTAEWRRT